MQLESFVVADLWDLEDRGLEPALDLLQNTLGVTGLTLRVDPPPQTQLRARSSDVPRLYTASGGLWFRTDPDRYRNTRLKPILAPEMRARDPFSRLADLCAKRDFRLRVWIDACHNPLAAARHPEMAAANALEHRSPIWLCPNHPDVRAYLAALLEDLCAAHPLDAIILASPLFLPPAEALPGVRSAFPIGPVERFLAGLCFCESCRQNADTERVEIHSVATLVCRLLSQRLSTPAAAQEPLDDLLLEHPHLARLHQWRRTVAARLIRSLADRISLPLVALEDVVDEMDPLPCERLVLNLDLTGAAAVERALQRAILRTGSADRIELLVELAPGKIGDAPALVSTLTRAAELNVTRMSLANLSLWPDQCLDWVRQALRNARRTGAGA